MVEVPESVRSLFVVAGWHPGRRVAVSPAVPGDHPAAEILAAFGGLTISQPEDAEGEECGLDDLMFRELHPDGSILDDWAGLLGTRLVGVADIHTVTGSGTSPPTGVCSGEVASTTPSGWLGCRSRRR